MGNQFSTQIISLRKKILQIKLQESRPSWVVVFDIDNTLCKTARTNRKSRLYHPECPCIRYTRNGSEIYHIFLPYLNILFEYLLQQGVRIAFFSNTAEKKNVTVIQDLLELFWGTEQCQILMSKGQFDIFSEHDVCAGHFARMSRNGKKDLEIVIRDTESLLDAILVEDNPTYSTFDQNPCVLITDVLLWSLEQINYQGVSFLDEYPKNSVYYMLGLFKTYFEEDGYKKLPLKVGIDKILPRENRWLAANHPFRLQMIHKGFEEVKKKAPNAIFYEFEGSLGFGLLSPKDQTWAKTEEVAYDSFIRHLISGNVPLYTYYLAKYLLEKFADTNQGSNFYQGSILSLIKSLKGRDDISVENGANIFDVYVEPTVNKNENSIATLLSFDYYHMY